MVRMTSTYLKNHFASLCLPAIESSEWQAGCLRGLNLTAENAKKREENLSMGLPTGATFHVEALPILLFVDFAHLIPYVASQPNSLLEAHYA